MFFTQSQKPKRKYLRDFLIFDVYCPCQRTLKKWSDRKKWVDEPVFKSYIFVKSPDSESKKLENS